MRRREFLQQAAVAAIPLLTGAAAPRRAPLALATADTEGYVAVVDRGRARTDRGAARHRADRGAARRRAGPGGPSLRPAGPDDAAGDPGAARGHGSEARDDADLSGPRAAPDGDGAPPPARRRAHAARHARPHDGPEPARPHHALNSGLRDAPRAYSDA